MINSVAIPMLPVGVVGAQTKTTIFYLQNDRDIDYSVDVQTSPLP